MNASRRQFFGHAAVAAVGLALTGGLALAAQQPKMKTLARFDGLLTGKPTPCDWFDLVAGDIALCSDGDMIQVEDFAQWNHGPDGWYPGVNCSIITPFKKHGKA